METLGMVLLGILVWVAGVILLGWVFRSFR